jgi:Muramidase (flagellum-specific)
MSYTREQFIEKLAPYAIEDRKLTGVPASLTIAQGCLESANGNSGLSIKANNLFGIKGKGSCGSATMPTTEYVNGKAIKVDAAFRAYNNWGESVSDHSSLLTRLSRYKNVLNTDGKTAAIEIQKAGYASDPNYSKLLISIMDKYNLYQYDKLEEEKQVSEIPPVKVIFTVDNEFVDGFMKDNLNYVPVSLLSTKLGDTVEWKNEIKQLYVNGKLVDALMKDNINFVSAQTIKVLGHKVTWDNEAKNLYISK